MRLKKFIKIKFMLIILTSMIIKGFTNNVNTGGQKGVVRAMSSYCLGLTGLNCGVSFKYDRDKHYIKGPGGIGAILDTSTGKIVEHRDPPSLISTDIYVAYGLFRYLDLSLDLPLYADVTGWGKKRSGVGDLQLAVKFEHPFRRPNNFFTNSYYLKITFPTGKQERGYFPRHCYYQTNDGTKPGLNQYTANSVLFNPMIIWTLDFNRLKKGFPLQIHANAGGVVTQVKNSSAAVGSFAIEYTPLDLLTFFLELSGEARIKHYTNSFKFSYFENDPLIFSPGMRLNLPIGIYATLAGDVGLSSYDERFRSTWTRNNYRYSTAPVPKYGFQFTLGWNGMIREPDKDKDGIIDKKDMCFDEPEDKDGFKDGDGCPDLDNDGDGIADLKDNCPDEKATCNGCPVYDTDNDGIVDKKDVCPQDAEDKDGFKDEDGCPELDNDKDGVNDDQDGCPNKPEDMDGFEDLNGCPDLDNDGDGILDESDKCPNIKGVAETQGCPKTKEIKRGKLILTGVNFRSGKAILTQNSYKILDQVYESLAEWTKVKLEIQGYTDSQGKYQYNKRLSQKRAEAVMNYLIQKGIDPARLKAVGFGEDGPIADNATAAGRAKNRRVELYRAE